MLCPYCGKNNDKVIDSRIADDGRSVRRRRQYILCGARFTSYERIERRLPKLIKRDGHREEFDPAKLERGLLSACRKRPIPSERITELINTIAEDLERLNKPEVSSSWLGQIVMNRLSELDAVAYVRFASVYSAFDDVNQFIELIQSMRNAKAFKRPRSRKRAPGAK